MSTESETPTRIVPIDNVGGVDGNEEGSRRGGATELACHAVAGRLLLSC